MTKQKQSFYSIVQVDYGNVKLSMPELSHTKEQLFQLTMNSNQQRTHTYHSTTWKQNSTLREQAMTSIYQKFRYVDGLEWHAVRLGYT